MILTFISLEALGFVASIMALSLVEKDMQRYILPFAFITIAVFVFIMYALF